MKKTNYSDELRSILSDRIFILCVLLTVVLTYGFATFNVTVSIDDLEGDRYVGSGNAMLAAGRFTITLLSVLFGYGAKVLQNAYAIDILAITGLIWSAANFCILFRRICKDAFTREAGIVFSCIFLSYPLMHEIWEYTGANLCVSFGFWADSIVLLLMYDVIHEHTPGRWKKILLSTVLMMFVCAGYESLVPVYVFTVFALLALQVIYGPQREKQLLVILRQGILYAAVLAVGLVLRILVHKAILFTLDLGQDINGSTFIYWGNIPTRSILKHLLLSWSKDYVLKGLIYLPIAELVIAGTLFLIPAFIACQKHGLVLLLPGVGMYLSLVILSLMQGTVSLYRSCQVFGMFVAFVLMYLVMCTQQKKNVAFQKGMLLLCCILCFEQASCNSYYITLNHQRSQEEAHVVQEIGTDLHSQFDLKKPVIFVGGYALSETIVEGASVPEDSIRWRLLETLYSKLSTVLLDKYAENFMNYFHLSRKIPQSTINSNISFCEYPFEGNQDGMQRLFAYYGFDHIPANYASVYPEAQNYIAEYTMPAYPRDGYIQDVGDYIIVHIG